MLHGVQDLHSPFVAYSLQQSQLVSAKKARLAAAGTLLWACLIVTLCFW